MKKFLTLFLLMLTAMGASAQITSLDELSTEKTYTLRNAFFNAYAVYNATKSTTTVWAAGMNKGNISDESYKAKVDLTSPNSAWMIVRFANKWYAYNMAAGKFLTVGYNPTTAATAQAKFDSTPRALEIKQKNGGFTLRTHTDGSQNFLCAAPQLPYPISIWTDSDNGATWEIAENPEVEADYDACIKKIKAGVPVGFDVNLSNGFAWAGNSVSRQQLPHEIARGKAYTFYVRASEGWICPDGLTIDNGEETFTISGIKDGKVVTAITIPADKATRNIMVTGTWKRDEANPKAQQLVFDDDFDVDGEPDETKWVRTVREGATWNRFCSNSDKVVFNKDGYLHCRALKNPKVTSEDPGEMITGGIKSLGKHDFLYGRIEARIKTNLHTGTFPAFWLMPTNNIGGWPHGGEIDIWEVINNEDRAYGTVHNSWACCTTGRPNGSNLSGINYDDWHVMTVDWDENQIDWYVDGKYMWTYSKSNVPHGADATTNGWPYDKPFYIIMNQSVGNGGWAARPDVNFTYETLFDWVRVYQIPSTPDGIGQTPAATSPMSNRIYDLSGRPVSGNPTKGVYIQGNKKVVK